MTTVKCDNTDCDVEVVFDGQTLRVHDMEMMVMDGWRTYPYGFTSKWVTLCPTCSEKVENHIAKRFNDGYQKGLMKYDDDPETLKFVMENIAKILNETYTP